MSHSKTTQDSDSDFDVDTFLRLESNSYNQEKEITRILNLFENSKNPLEILEIDYNLWIDPKEYKDISEWIPAKLIKNQFRKKSLLVHPDKCPLKEAPDAFQILKKAENQLSNPISLQELYNYIKDARYLVKQAKKSTQPFDVVIQVRVLLKGVETRNQLRIKNSDEREAQQAAEEERKRKKQEELDKKWAATREVRVGTWRNFHTSGPKKKKIKKDNDGLL